MSKPGEYRRKTDRNQADIVMALRQIGAQVLDLHAVGGGCPDILCLYHDTLYLLEVKNLAGRGKRLTPDEIEFAERWPVSVVCDTDEALRAIGAI